MITFPVNTASRVEFVDITPKVKKSVAESGVREGFCVVYVPHTTAGITINENADPDVVSDIIMHLSRLVPPSGNFRHSEGNSDAHIKASLMGFSQTLLVQDGNIVLGRWQALYFCEFDGPRQRKVSCSIFGRVGV